MIGKLWVGLLGGALLLATQVPVSLSAQASERAHVTAAKHLTCLQYVLRTTVTELTGFAATLRGGISSTAQTGVWQYNDETNAGGRTPGTGCQWISNQPQVVGWPPPVPLSAYVAVGFGYTASNFKKLEAFYRSGLGLFTASTGWSGQYSLLKLNVPGSSSFLMTYNEWTPYQASTYDDPSNFPEYAYVIMARSKTGNVLLVWFTSAAGGDAQLLAHHLAVTKQRATSMLKSLS